MKLQSNRTGKIKDWSFSEWLHYIICSEGKTGEACDVKEFIERVEKFKDEWEENPKEAWLINANGELENWPDTEWADDWDSQKEIGNYFETKEEAEKAVEKLKAWKRLKDKGFRFKGWEDSPAEDDFDMIWFTMKAEVWDIETQEALTLLFGGEE